MKLEDGNEGNVAFRVLCPVERIEAVIPLSVGGARIRFDSASASPFPSDRVVLISPTSSNSSSQNQNHALITALLSVFDRIVPQPQPQHLSYSSSHHHQSPGGVVMCRLLSPPSQLRCFHVPTLDRLHQDTAALVRVFPREHAFPSLPSFPHDLLTLTGTFPAVRKALLAVSTLLLEAVCTTTQVLIPSHYLPFVTGTDGSDLCHIKQISGANLTVEDPKPGETAGKVIIFGTAEQTKTAQSLVHGLIFCGVFNPS